MAGAPHRPGEKRSRGEPAVAEASLDDLIGQAVHECPPGAAIVFHEETCQGTRCSCTPLIIFPCARGSA